MRELEVAFVEHDHRSRVVDRPMADVEFGYLVHLGHDDVFKAVALRRRRAEVPARHFEGEGRIGAVARRLQQRSRLPLVELVPRPLRLERWPLLEQLLPRDRGLREPVAHVALRDRVLDAVPRHVDRAPHPDVLAHRVVHLEGEHLAVRALQPS